MKLQVFLRPDSAFMTRETGNWNVDLYDGKCRYVGGYHLESKKLAKKLAKHIRKTGEGVALSLAGTWK